MPRKKPYRRPKNHTLLSISVLLIIFGLIGLVFSSHSFGQSKIINPTTSQLPVLNGTSNGTNQSQSEATVQLQGAARVKDLIQGKEGNNIQPGNSGNKVQPGTSINDLLKDKKLK